MWVWKVLITWNSTHKTHSHTSICIDVGSSQMHIYGVLSSGNIPKKEEFPKMQ